MVLSNKKLKQKLRAELSKSLVSAASDASCSANPESFRQLVGEATQKPILSKREKRRKAIRSQEFEIIVNNTSNGNTIVKKQEKPNLDSSGGGTGETGDEKTKKKKSGKKKKRGADGGSVDAGGEAEGSGKAEEEAKKLNDEKKKSGNKRKRGDDGDSGDVDSKAVEEAKKKLSDEKKKLSDEKKKKIKMKLKKLKAKKKKKAQKKSAKEKGQLDKAAEVVTEANGQQQQEVDYGNSQGSVIVPNKVYVGGIPYYSTEEDIRSFFEHCGTIADMECMTFPDTGKFRGIAILTFKTEEAAKRALALDGADMGGFFLKIELYKKTRSATKLPEFCPPVIQGYHRIYVGNLSWDITEDHLKKLFSECSISSIRFGEDKVTGEFKGYAHVDFSDDVSVEKALKLDQSIVLGRPVRISRAVAQRSVGSIVGGGGSRSESKVEATSAAEYIVEQNATNNGNVLTSESTITATVEDTVAATVTASTVVAAGKIKRRTCYECGERGHISSACPKKQVNEPPIESTG